VKLRRLQHAYWSLLYQRWPRPRARVPGYTLILTVPPDLPVFLRLAVDVLRRQDPAHLVETLVVPDAYDRGFAREVSGLAAEWPEGRMRLVQPGAKDRLVRSGMSKASLIHWLQLVVGARETRSTHAVLHDVDLFVLERGFLRSLYEACRDGGYACLGNEAAWKGAAWTQLPRFAHVVALWELALDLDWLRARPPSALRPQWTRLPEGFFWFETSLLAQAYTSPDRVARHQADAGVHFGWVIGGYRAFERSRGRFVDDQLRLLLIRLLIDAFDPEGGPYRVPALAELVRGLRDPTARVGYSEEARRNYPAFRGALERILESDLFPARSRERIRAGTAAFDAAFAWKAGGAALAATGS
jgi:hypothetical protein